jgi:hypothetical protein
MGGEVALNKLQGVTYRTPRYFDHQTTLLESCSNCHSIYHTQSLMQNYNLVKSDQFVAITGKQEISFSYNSSVLLQHIDRSFIPSGQC